jgi:U4/U6 small nuclear ribonucleoprotein PRP31
MTTLAENFLADLDELSDIEEYEAEQHQHQAADDNAFAPLPPAAGDIHSIAALSNSSRYQQIMTAVNQALQVDESSTNTSEWTGPTEEDPAYKLIVDCNSLAVDIDNEIITVYNFIRDKYKPKFPELESLVTTPLEYSKVVAAIANEMDATAVNLDALLPPAQVMVVTVTATTTSGQPLDEQTLAQVLQACELAVKLDTDRAKIIQLVQRRMDKIAPNLSAALGTEIAAQLMGVAGGLAALSRIPAGNVQVLGAKKRNLAGFSTRTVQPHQGFIFGCDLIQNHTPPSLHVKAGRLIAGKCTLLARMDAFNQDPTGSSGRAMREEIMKKIEKLQEPPQARNSHVLPIPDAQKKPKRGGKKYRKLKEKFGMTELKKQANRMMFNQAEEEILDGDDTLGLGAIGKDGSGRMRALAAQQKQKLSAKAAKKFNLHRTSGGGIGGGGGMMSRIPGAGAGASSGLSSNLAFTPVQGIELVNPMAAQQQQPDTRPGTESYFSGFGGFRSSAVVIGGGGGGNKNQQQQQQQKQ